MKQTVFFICFVFTSLCIHAQEDKEQQLEEVVISAAKTVTRPDGMAVFPTKTQLLSSSSGYDLLQKLNLPDIKIDATLHQISTIDEKGSVELRINDIKASKEDLISLDMNTVKRIDYISSPGVRYGTNVAAVINITTGRLASGYTLGADITQTLTARNADYNVFFKTNKGKHELDFDYDFAWDDMRGARTNSTSEYEMSDGSVVVKTENDTESRTKNRNHNMVLRYSFADSDRFVLQTKLSGSLYRTPERRYLRDISIANDAMNAERLSTERSTSPALDIYLFSKIGKHQSITADILGTYISDNYTYYNKEGAAEYQYQANGNTWSMIGEAIYENQLRPFTFSAGMQISQKYLSTDYAGDVKTTTDEHTSSTYLFAQVKGNLQKLLYTLGLGASRKYYSQGTNRYDYILFRPRLTLTYPLIEGLNLNYSFQVMQREPRPELLGDVQIRLNTFDVSSGNPELTTFDRIENELRLSYQRPRLYTSLTAYYRQNHRVTMEDVYRENDLFVFKYYNQRDINFFYIKNFTSYDLIPDHLVASASGGVYRCLNYGNDYKHHYTSFNWDAQLQAYVGRFSANLHVDNGWRVFEGQRKIHNSAACYLTANYRLKNLFIGFVWQHPFNNNPKLNEEELISANLHRKTASWQSDYGNMFTLRLTYKFSKGRKTKGIERKIENEETQTGTRKQ